MRMDAFRPALAGGLAAMAIGLAPVPQAAAQAGPTDAELIAEGRSTDNVLTYGMGYHQNRYSPLAQVNRSTVKRLVPIWSTSVENDYGEQAQPLVYDGVMYVTNARMTLAIDVATGKTLWRTPVDWDPATPRVVCCGISNKGPAIYNGKVFRTTLDAHVLALDMKTGKQVWKQKVAEWKEGYSLTLAPQVANGVLIHGISGAEYGIRGFIDGRDPETGKLLWRRHTTAAPGEPGGDTWPPGNAYLNGGGSTWITGSYDPELDLAYWGTGNAGPWNPSVRPGDNLYVASVLAIRPKTGQIVWHYQFNPGDMYDFDSLWELILGELAIDGQKRKVVMQMNRNGFLYVLDRATGKLLSAKPYAKVNWASHVDMATGRPVHTELGTRLRKGEWVDFWPGLPGGKNWEHAAFDPVKGLLYAATLNEPRTYRLIPVEPYKPGQRYAAFETKVLPLQPGEPVGWIEAIDPLTAKPKWRHPLPDHQIRAAVLATGGGLVFTGKHTGEFIALDADTGRQVWSFRVSSGINSQPITYTHKGRQFVSVQVGLGGLYGQQRTQALANVPRGGSVWTFALMND